MLRTKVFAAKLGPEMFGVMSIYNAIIGLVIQITSLGLGQSAVREIAAAATDNPNHVGNVIISLRRLVLMSGVVGMAGLIVAASYVSIWSFGDAAHSTSIALLSLAVLFTQVQTGQAAVIQGLRRIRDLGAINVLGALLGTCCAIPLVYLYGQHAVAPFLIAVAAGQLVVNWWYASRVPLPETKVSWGETWQHSRSMLKLGLAMVTAGIAVSVSVFAIRVIIQRAAGEAAVGQYQAAFAISTIYVGFILQAMAGDYYPRLCGLGGDVRKRNECVNEQLEMALLLGVPGLLAAILYSDMLIELLYSSQFTQASGVLRWHAIGVLGRLISWPLGFILIGLADKRAFLLTEVTIAALHIVLVVCGVRWWGVVGAGAAFAALYVVYVAVIYAIVRTRHSFEIQPRTARLVLASVCATLLAFGLTFVEHQWIRSGLGAVLLAVVSLSAFSALSRRIGGNIGVLAIQAVVKRCGLAR